MTPFVQGIGVSNPKTNIDFTPNFSQDYSNTISNSRDVPILVKVDTRGELSKYVNYIEENFTIDAHSSYDFRYDIKLPEDLIPGEHEILLIFSDNNVQGSGNLAFSAAVGVKIAINVPHPGYLATVELDVPDVNEGEKVSYTATIENHGINDITGAEATIYFRNLDGDQIDKYSFDDIDIDSLKSYQIKETADVFDKGEYTAEAVFKYEKEAKAFDNFTVGSYDISITNTSDKLYAGQITPFKVDVKNEYNGNIPAVYTKININGNEYRSIEKSLSAFQKARFDIYIDDLTLQEGVIYPLDITIVYAPEETKQIISLTAENMKKIDIPSSMKSPGTYLILLVILLIILNMYIIFRKKK